MLKMNDDELVPDKTNQNFILQRQDVFVAVNDFDAKHSVRGKWVLVVTELATSRAQCNTVHFLPPCCQV